MKKNILLRVSIQSMLALCLSLASMMITSQETRIAFADGISVATFIVHPLNQNSGSLQSIRISPPNICITPVKNNNWVSWGLGSTDLWLKGGTAVTYTQYSRENCTGTVVAHYDNQLLPGSLTHATCWFNMTNGNLSGCNQSQPDTPSAGKVASFAVHPLNQGSGSLRSIKVSPPDICILVKDNNWASWGLGNVWLQPGTAVTYTQYSGEGCTGNIVTHYDNKLLPGSPTDFTCWFNMTNGNLSGCNGK